MNRLLKSYSIIFFLSVLTSLKAQVFTFADSIPTKISGVTHRYLPVHAENNFNFLFYPIKNKNQNFELITLKDTVISKMEIKNRRLDGGGSWYTSAAMSDKHLLLLHVDGFLVIYEKNKKGNYAFKETLNIKGIKFNIISFLDAENLLLMNDYNRYNETKLYDDYALCVFNLRTKKVIHDKEIDLGKGILFSHFASTLLMESKKNRIAVAHPTLPFIYVYNDKLESIDTVFVKFQDAISVDSAINAVFTDLFIEQNRFNPGLMIETIENKKINQMERIEKVFWLNEDILGYTVCQPFSQWARIFVFYSLSEKRELYKKIEFYSEGEDAAYNFINSTRILINNNKTIYHKARYEEDESNFYYEFRLYDMLPFFGTK